MFAYTSAFNAAYRSWIALWVGLAILASAWTVATARPPSMPASGLRSLSPVQTAPSTIAQVSGFSVEAMEAKANGLYIDVVVEVNGRPEAGDDLLFLPGPVLTWPGGEESRLLSGSSDGRRISLRFDRGSVAMARQGDELLLTMYGLAPRGYGQPPATALTLPAQLRVVLKGATNGRSIQLPERMALGDGHVALDRVLIDGGWVRVAGHFEQLSPPDVAALSLRQSLLSDTSGLTVSPAASRSGYGVDGNGFHLDFFVGNAEPMGFDLAVALTPSHVGPTSEALTAALSSPKHLLVDLGGTGSP